MVVVQGDLTTAYTDVIVDVANEYLWHGGGVAAALARVGGEEFLADLYRWISEHGPLRPGQAAVTVGGGLRARWVVHMVGPRYGRDGTNQTRLREAVPAALDASAGRGAETVAMPAISTGVFGHPLESAAEVIASEYVRGTAQNPGRLSEIQLTGYDLQGTDTFRQGLENAPA